MSETKTYKYYAFVSYSRKDEKDARWLHRKLENCRIPTNLPILDKMVKPPKYIRPLFRDKTDLDVKPSSFVEDIQNSLRESRYLLVLCSPNAAQLKAEGKHYVDMEIRQFIEYHGEAYAMSHILPVILAGEVNSGNPETECLPPALKELGTSFLERNFPMLNRDFPEAMPSRDAQEECVLQCLAFLLGVNYNVLNERFQRSERSRMRRRISIITTLALIFAGLTAWAVVQRNHATVAKRDAVKREQEANSARAFAESQKNRAEESLSEQERLSYLNGIMLAKSQTDSGKPFTATKTLQSLPKKQRGWEWGYLLNKNDLKPKAVFKKGKSLCVELCNINKSVYAVFQNGDVVVYDTEKTEVKRQFSVPVKNELISAKFDRKRSLMVMVEKAWKDDLSSCQIWDFIAGKKLKTLQGPPDVGQFFEVQFVDHDNLQYLVVGTAKGSILVWEYDSGKLILQEKLGCFIHAVGVGTDGTVVAAYSNNNQKHLLAKVNIDKSRISFNEIKGFPNSCVVFSVCISDDGRYLAAASIQNRSVTITDMKTGEAVFRREFDAVPNCLQLVSFQGDLCLLFSTHKYTLSLIKIPSGETIISIPEIFTGNFDPESGLLNGYNSDGSYVFDVSQAQLSNHNMVQVKMETLLLDVTPLDNAALYYNYVERSIHYVSPDRGDEILRKIGNTELFLSFSSDGKVYFCSSNKKLIARQSSTGIDLYEMVIDCPEGFHLAKCFVTEDLGMHALVFQKVDNGHVVSKIRVIDRKNPSFRWESDTLDTATGIDVDFIDRDRKLAFSFGGLRGKEKGVMFLDLDTFKETKFEIKNPSLRRFQAIGRTNTLAIFENKKASLFNIDNQVSVWGVNRLLGVDNWICSVDGSRLIYFKNDAIHIVDPRHDVELLTIDNLTASLCRLYWSRDGSTLVALKTDTSIKKCQVCFFPSVEKGASRGIHSVAEFKRDYTEALRMIDLVHPSDSEEKADCIHSVAFSLSEEGFQEEALTVNHLCLDLRKRLYGKDHEKIAISLNNMASCLEGLGKSEEAVTLYKKALEMRRRLGSENTEITLVMKNLALCLFNMGRMEEALNYYQGAWEISLRTNPADSESFASNIYNIGACLKALEKYPDAMDRFQSALQMFQRVYKKCDQQNIVSCLEEMAECCDAGLNKPDLAYDYYRQSANMAFRLRRSTNPDTWQYVVYVKSVVDSSQATAVGIQVGDEILSYNGVRCMDVQQLQNLVRRGNDNSEITIEILREGKLKDFKLKPGTIGVNLDGYWLTRDQAGEAFEKYGDEIPE